MNNLDISPEKVYASFDSHKIQSSGQLSAQPQPSGDGHESAPPEGFDSGASKGRLFPFGGFFIREVS
jgi:hypothetical protein